MTAEISLQRSTVVCKRLGRSRATLHNDLHDGLLTPAITIGKRWSAWPSDEIDAILRARIAGWDKAEIRLLVKQLIGRRKTAAPVLGRIGGDDRHVSIGS